MGVVEVLLESTASRRGGHAARSAAVIVEGPGRARVVSPPSGSRPVRGTYSRGRAYLARVNIPPGAYLVHVRFVRSPSGRVTGRIVVYDDSGAPRLAAVYRRLKVRRSWGDPTLAWAVEEALKTLGVERYVRRYNWRTGSSEPPR